MQPVPVYATDVSEGLKHACHAGAGRKGCPGNTLPPSGAAHQAECPPQAHVAAHQQV